MPKVLITPILQKSIGLSKTTQILGDFREIAKIFTCLDKVRGVGVITTLGTGKIISPKGCSKGIDHHPGREFPCGMGFSVSRIFRWVKTHRFGNSLPFGKCAGGGRSGANSRVRNNPYLSY